MQNREVKEATVSVATARRHVKGWNYLAAKLIVTSDRTEADGYTFLQECLFKSNQLLYGM